MSELSAADRREYARIEREEARAQALGRPITSPDDVPAPVAAAPTPAPVAATPMAAAPTPAPASPAPSRAAAPKPAASVARARAAQVPAPVAATTKPAPTGLPYTLVDELPPSRQIGRPVPAIRRQMIAHAKNHPGRWLNYVPSAGDPFKSAASITSLANKGRGGFSEGFEAKIRDKNLYIRYVGGQ